MHRDRLLGDAAAVETLAKRLEESNVLTQGQRGAKAEAEALARALADIEESAQRFLCEELPRLLEYAKTREETEEVLADVRTETCRLPLGRCGVLSRPPRRRVVAH